MFTQNIRRGVTRKRIPQILPSTQGLSTTSTPTTLNSDPISTPISLPSNPLAPILNKNHSNSQTNNTSIRHITTRQHWRLNRPIHNHNHSKNSSLLHSSTTPMTKTTTYTRPATNNITIPRRNVSFDPKKWERDYNPKSLLPDVPLDPYKRPNPKSTIDPTFDPGRDQRKTDHIQRLRWQLREGVFVNDAFPRTRDPNDPLKPFIPQIPLMEDTPFAMQRPTPIWDTLRDAPRFRDFIAHYLPNKVKMRRTKALLNEYMKGPLDVLHPKYKQFVKRFFGIKQIIGYCVAVFFGIYLFEIGLLLNTELEEMFEITAKNLLRSESFIVTANTVQEMVNIGLLDPSLSVLESKIFLEETLNVGYAYNAQVMKDLSYLMEGFHKALDIAYPDKDNPAKLFHIDHFSQTDTDISYLPLDRYLTSFERFLEVYYTKNIDMVGLADMQPYNPKITSPRQVFFANMRALWYKFANPLINQKDKFVRFFDLSPNVDNGNDYNRSNNNNSISSHSDTPDTRRSSNTSRNNDNPNVNGGSLPYPRVIERGNVLTGEKILGMSINQDPFATNYVHNDPIHENSIDARIRNAELHNIDFSQSATLQFNPNIGKVVDFYFDELPSNFAFSNKAFFSFLNPKEESIRRREQHIATQLNKMLGLTDGDDDDDDSVRANPLLKKDPNISYNSDHKYRFLTESFLPTHLQAFKSAYIQSKSIHNVEQLAKESQSISLRTDDPNNVANSTIAALYKQQGTFELMNNHRQVIERYQRMKAYGGDGGDDGDGDGTLSLHAPRLKALSTTEHPLWLTPPQSYQPHLLNGYGVYYHFNNLLTDYHYNHDLYFYNTSDPNDGYLSWLGKLTYNGMLHLTDYSLYGLTEGSKYVANTVTPYLPYILHTLVTDPLYLKRNDEYEIMKQVRNDEVEFQKKELEKAQAALRTGGDLLSQEYNPTQQTVFGEEDQKLYNPLQWHTVNRAAQERNKLLLLNAENLTLQERINKINKNKAEFNTDGFNTAFNELARRDYIDMLLRYNDMLLHMRQLFSTWAKNLHMNIDDFVPEYGTIVPQLQRTPYLWAYYNHALRDLYPMVQSNPNFPLLPILYQYNDVDNKGIRVLQQRLDNEQRHRLGQFYRTQTLKDVMSLQRLDGLVEDGDEGFNKRGIFQHLKRAFKIGYETKDFNYVRTTLMNPEIISLFQSESSSTRQRPIFVLDSVVNRFGDDDSNDDYNSNNNNNEERKMTDLQAKLGMVVTKLDLCLLQTYAEIERQRALFDTDPGEDNENSIIPPYIHVNTNLLMKDERFAFDLAYQQEDEIRQQRIQQFAPHAGKTLDWFSEQAHLHSPMAQQPPLRPHEIEEKMRKKKENGHQGRV